MPWRTEVPALLAAWLALGPSVTWSEAHPSPEFKVPEVKEAAARMNSKVYSKSKAYISPSRFLLKTSFLVHSDRTLPSMGFP